MPSFPGSIVSLSNPATGNYTNNPSHIDQHADANDEIEAIETELGTNPSGAAATVAARFTAAELVSSDHLADTGDAHDASAISIADAGNDFTATTVEGALDELQADHELDASNLADHIAANNGILAVMRYAPTTQATYSTTSTSMVDVDATNMAITFTAPASGKILVRLNAFGDMAGAAGEGYWGLRESTTNLAGIARIMRIANAEGYFSVSYYLTGVTAGAHTYKWAYGVDSGTTRVIVMDGSVISEWAPAIMEVWAVP